MTITLLIEDSPYGFIAFLHTNFPQGACKALRFKVLRNIGEKLGKISHNIMGKVTKNKWNKKEKRCLFS